MSTRHFVTVFPAGPSGAKSRGGNPCPITLNADGLSSEEMRGIAAQYGHEASFVCAASSTTSPGSTTPHLARLRFFVPAHEMEMCGHASLGTAWLLRRLGLWEGERGVLETMSGDVDVWAEALESTEGGQTRIHISQPAGTVTPIDDALTPTILSVLGLGPADLAGPVVNACTSRPKTLIPLKSVEALQALKPRFGDMQSLCDSLDSTGLYPFAVDSDASDAALTVHARQFPRSSGYPEDAATGIAAAASLYGLLHYGLLAPGRALAVKQGWAMGCPSEIRVALRQEDDPQAGVWVSGAVEEIAPIEGH